MTYSSIHSLEDLLGSGGRIAVLRTIAQACGPLTGRQVAEASGLSHAGAMRVLDRLVEAGLVTRTPVGRAMLHEVDRNHVVFTRLVRPLLAAEAELLSVPRAADTVSARNAVNPRVRPYLAAVEAACRRNHVAEAAIFGSATQSDPDVTPRDLDVLVTFDPLEPQMKAEAYAALTSELEAILGMPVDVMVSSAIRNPYLANEISRTKVVLYEVA